ncbi:hypothetical protein HDV03_003086 [Kappamyces sp. JEL0829]|nr:hypothetical protein HDV03_003086 [Kappamyces sp. JEL0829]
MTSYSTKRASAKKDVIGGFNPEHLSDSRGGSLIRHLELRMMTRMDPLAIQPESTFVVNFTPPFAWDRTLMGCVTTKFIHTSTNKVRCPVNTLRWTPEGRRLITGASSGEFTLWNGMTFNFETILQAHDTAIRCMRWSNNATWMISGEDSGIIKYWQSNMNNLKAIQGHRESVRDLVFSPTDTKFASCSDDGTIKIWDFTEAAEERVLTVSGMALYQGLEHGGLILGLLGSGSKDNLAKLWDPKSGKNIATLHGHKNTVMQMQWNANGNWLVTACRDQLVRVYDIRTMKEMQVFRGHKREVQSVSWHPVHEQLLVSGGWEGSIFFWQVGEDRPLAVMETAHESSVFALDWHPLGHILASGSNDHATKFWTRNRPGDAMNDRYNLSKEEADALGLKAGDDDDDHHGPSGGRSSFGNNMALPGLGERPAFGDLGDFSKRAGEKSYSRGDRNDRGGDPRVGYVGCLNAAKFCLVDNFFLAFHSITWLLYTSFLAFRFKKHAINEKKPVKSWFNDMDFTALLAIILCSIRIGALTRMRLASSFSLSQMSDADLEVWVAGNILIDMIHWVIGGLAVNAIVKSVVQSAAGANLYRPFKVWGREIDPTRALLGLRIVILILNGTFFGMFANRGVHSDLATYYLWKRFAYFFVGFLSGMLSPSILFFFGVQVIRALKASNGMLKPPSRRGHPWGFRTSKRNSSLAGARSNSEPPIEKTADSPNDRVGLESEGVVSESSHKIPKNIEFRIRSLEIAIFACVFLLCVPCGLICWVHGFIDQVIPHDHEALFLTKVVLVFNKATLVGRMGAEPVFKALEKQPEDVNPEKPKGFYKFPLVTSKRQKNNLDEWIEQPTWHNIHTNFSAAIPKGGASSAHSLGSLVVVEGEIRNLKPIQEGQSNYSFIWATNVSVISWKKPNQESGTADGDLDKPPF